MAVSKELFTRLLQDHVAGVRDRSGVSPLEITVKSELSKGTSESDLHKVLKKILEENDTAGLWAAIRFAISLIDTRSSVLAQAIVRKLDKKHELSPTDRFNALVAAITLGYAISPRAFFKNHKDEFAEHPHLLLDLALNIFRGDPKGLMSELYQLFGGAAPKLEWTELRKRFLAFQEAIRPENPHQLIAELAQEIGRARGGGDLLVAYNKRYGTSLTLKSISQPIIPLQPIAEVVDNPVASALGQIFIFVRRWNEHTYAT